MKASKYLSILAIAALFSACAKDGATGPQGPAGQNGVANISITGYSIGTASWTQYSATQWYVNTTVSLPTSDVAVVYYSLSGTSYSPLPGNSVFYNGDVLTFSYSTGYVLTLWYTDPLGNPPSALVYVNVVDIPPAIQYQYPATDWQNKSEVSRIPEVQAALNNANNK